MAFSENMNFIFCWKRKVASTTEKFIALTTTALKNESYEPNRPTRPTKPTRPTTHIALSFEITEKGFSEPKFFFKLAPARYYFNILTIASFRMGVPSILFSYCRSEQFWKHNTISPISERSKIFSNSSSLFGPFWTFFWKTWALDSKTWSCPQCPRVL